MMAPVIRARRSLLVLSLALAALLLTTPAGARPKPVKPPAEVEVGRPGAGSAPSGLPSLLVPVRYPIQLAGRLVETRVDLIGPGGGKIRSWTLRKRLNSGKIRRPERRRIFSFVHRIDLRGGVAGQVRTGVKVRVGAQGVLDLDEDGRAELRSADRETHRLSDRSRAKPLCNSIPPLRVRPGERVSIPLPACDSEFRWLIRREPKRGVALMRRGRLTYRAPQRWRGRQPIQLVGIRLEGPAGRRLAILDAQVTIGDTTGGAVVRALGDSVTAGFGYYDDGSSMTIGRLLECRPGAKQFNDACSSNSLNRVSKEEAVKYAADYGLANNVSWAAQWANEHGIVNFKNFAISGSEPADWAPGGEFHKTTELLESEDPDYILMTMGANPLLSEMLFGTDNMGCAIYADVFGGYRECVEAAFAEVHLQEHLESLYSDLVKNTNATIFLMQYHLSVPSTALAYSATQIAMMGKLLNREIAAVAAAVSPKRLQVVAPPHFDVGIDISPVYPSRFSCSSFGYKVDGPSVQSDPTQDELEVLHPLSFCEGPAVGPPWVISGDTGIHPSSSGYAQMASRVPAPN